MKGYQCIADTLKKNGITHVFYEELAFYFTTKILAASGISNILAHSEEAAGYMADGYARVTGKVGVCMSQAIGSANLAAGVHDAWLAATPVLALTGFKANNSLQRNGYQESDHKALFSGVTKYNQTVYDPQQLPFLLNQCFRAASSGQPRPVHLDVLGYAGELAEKAEMDAEVQSEIYGSFPAKRFSADQKDIERAAEIIDASMRPVIVAGRGAAYSDREGKSLRTLAAKGDIPVASTPDGKTIFDEDDPLWCGIVGGYGMDCANNAASAADLVIYIGSMVSDQTTLNFTAPDKNSSIIQIDIDGTEIGKNYPHTYGLVGDAAFVMEQLTAAIRKKKRTEWKKQVRTYVEDTLARQAASAENSGQLTTPLLMKVLSESLPDDAVVIADTGYSAIWSCTYLRMKSTQLYARAGGSLGWAFPASLGAKCGCPDRPVFAFVGDGAFYYHLSELETAVRYGIQTITVVNNNGKFKQCIPYVKEAYWEQEDAYSTYKNKVSFGSTDFVKVAEAFGAVGIKVTKPEELGPAISKALNTKQPVVIEVITTGDCDPLDPGCSGASRSPEHK